jgi:hypothetical protein
MDSYWDLYVAYVNKCVHDNYRNDVDPNHHRMEWNHWLPKACFPDLPVGQWLTLKQHAVASALQTLALKKNCLCGWHLKYLPEKLKSLAWDYYIEFQTLNGVKSGEFTKKNKLGIHKPGAKTSETCAKGGKAGGRVCRDTGVGLFAAGNVTKDTCSRGGKQGCKNTNSQRWVCLETGYTSTPAGLTRYQSLRGIDTSQRKRLS